MIISVQVKLKKNQNRVYWQEDIFSEEMERNLIVETSEKPTQRKSQRENYRTFGTIFPDKENEYSYKRGKNKSL
jgi:hypothetical protein